MLSPGLVEAQVSSYVFAASSGTYTPLPASATQVPAILADDVISGALPIGFPFVFDGVTYTELRASSNGFLSFNPAAGSNLTNSLATATNERPLIAPFWDDLDGRPMGATASASYQVTGTAPNRVFTFEWYNWEWFYTANVAVISFQVKLFEGSNQIRFIYQPEANMPSGGLSASIGIAGGGAAGCASDFLSLNNASASPVASSTTETTSINTRPASGQTYSFTPPPPPMGTCAAVRCANVSNITGNSAQLNFSGSSNVTSYTVTYQAMGGATQTVTPAPTASPVNLMGLSVNTSYTATIVANCASGASTPVTVSFTTSNGYCVTGSGGTVLGGVCGGNNLTDIALVGTSLNATNLTCNTPVAGTAYTNYPASGSTTTTLQQGVTYPITVNTTGNSIVSVWIDYNRNLVFEASEWVQIATTTTAGTAVTANITIPTNALAGPTGMRVRSRASGSPNGASDACTQFFSGETKDFTVTIGPPPACPAPTGLTATNVTTTSATLEFTTVGAGTYTLIYGPQGFNPAVSGTTVTPATSPVNVTGLQAGTTYQFYVQRDCGAAGPSVNVGPISFTTLIVNDDPCGATTLPLNLTGCMPYATTSTGSTTTTPNGYTNPGTGCGIATAPRDVWFKFTTAASGAGATDVRVTVTGGAASVVQALSANDCMGPFTPIRCSGTTANVAAPALDLTNLSPNTTYYVRVYNYTAVAQSGNFTICVTPLPSCPAPTGSTAINITKNSATLSWMTGAGAPSGSTYTLTYGPPGFNPDQAGTTIPSVSGNSFQLTGLTPQTDYCYYIRLNCGGINGNSQRVGPICFQTLLENPANDDPCGAQALTSGAAAVPGTTVGASTTLISGITLPACSPASNPRDVWYTVTMPAATVGTDSLIIRLTGAAAGMVRVYTSPDCASGPFASVACQAASSSNTGFAAPIRIGNLLPGTTYYLAVSGYGSSDTPGTFNIGVQTIYVGPTCNAVTALAAGSLTQTSASVSFTPGANNTSYTVTYGPTGGMATTITATASPVALTGLLAGTNYTVTVTPLCSNGGSAMGSTITFNTVAPTCDPVTALAVGSITSNSASVSFTPGAGNTSYNVSISAPGNPTTVVMSTSSPVALTGLQASTMYTVTVTPVCSAGGMAMATTTTFSTTAPVCNPVTALAVSNVTSASATVSFTAGTGNTSYTVAYTATGGGTTVVTATSSPVMLSGLTPGTPYTVSVTPLCSAGGTATATTTTFNTPLKARTALGNGVVGVFPNPAHHSFTLSVPAVGSARTATVEILNTLGQLMSKQSIALTATGTQATVDVSSLATGVYLVQVRAGQDTAIVRLVVE
ncbi:hypothetical protein GCM10023185_11690 [Hymenobacter saemangeumensis]|uniref:Fibronectin type-III domain-containing protein n=1 Tax=Hymenobacter saemangeumensis TaxID=1084522 RepID=A0ABP8I6P4_9BACT